MPEGQETTIADQEIEGASEQREAQRLHDEVWVDAGPRHGRQQERHDGEHDHLVAHRARARR
jgi:hypothetical protein